MWCLERWELQVSVNLPRSTPPTPTDLQKSSVILPLLLLSWGSLNLPERRAAFTATEAQKMNNQNRGHQGTWGCKSCRTSLAISLAPLTEVSVCLSCSLACCFAPSHMSTRTRSEERRHKVWEEGKSKRGAVVGEKGKSHHDAEITHFSPQGVCILAVSYSRAYKFASGLLQICKRF